MTSINGHFDGKTVVLDEPAPFVLAVGQPVRVVVDLPARADARSTPALAGAELGAWKGKLQILDGGDEVILDHFKEGFSAGFMG